MYLSSDDLLSIKAYDSKLKANDYSNKKGFDIGRKEEMLKVALSLLIDLSPTGGSLLELGAGTGIFTKMIIDAEYFEEILITDGSEAMLEIARNELSSTKTRASFETLDFTRTSWSINYVNRKFDVVSSSMALHHAMDKRTLFTEINNVLRPGGILVFADHMAGASLTIDKLIGAKRARIKLNSLDMDINDENIKKYIHEETINHASKGKNCESVENYLNYLKESGFDDIDCIWRDYWLAVFVARKKEI